MIRARDEARGLAACACLLGVLLACGERAPAHEPDLAQYLVRVAGTPERASVVASWRLSREEWDRVVVEPYRALHADYVRELDAARATLVEQLATRRSILARAHFAGDQAATHAQAITRWALPTLAPTKIAELAGRPGTPIDAVFVDVGGRWRAIVGLDAIVRRAIAAFDGDCAAALDRIDVGGGTCIEVMWSVADAALRSDRDRLVHACSRAANLCGKRSGP